MTPDQFGAAYGSSDADIVAVQAWLQSHGFTVGKLAKGKTAIEFSGTAGQVRNAFHTALHTYKVNGETHIANQADPQIPAALSGIIAGISSLNDFRPVSQMKKMGKAVFNADTRKVVPQWTTPDGNGGNFYAVGPKDLATQYDITPLHASGLTGTGQTIGIINDSNIDLGLVSAYRKLFALDTNSSSPNLPQIVIDGADPGLTADSGEAYLDVEMVAAVAPQANVNLYIAADTDLSSGLILSMVRAVTDDTASVLSLSFGECEAGEGASNMTFLSELWEQAAAQGQTVLVSTGDSGSAGCDGAGNPYVYDGLQVNGFASTAWNVAVGGTDFYYSDYATGAPSAAQYWSTQNDASLGSLLKPVPEQPWNDSQYGLNNSALVTLDGTVAAGGGGGQSTCAYAGGALEGTNPLMAYNYCEDLGGFPKPSWQHAPGVPNDQVRDLPDVSLFAANGINNSFYAVCTEPGDCGSVASTDGEITYSGVGGTSASTPAFAAIMALVNQKYGPQGQANYVLYALANQKPSIFHDVTVGSNNMPCDPNFAGFQCTPDATGGGTSIQGWNATAGYDLATGLGSVDANALVSSWNTVTFASTTTTLTASPTTVKHGQPLMLTTKVAAGSGTTTPTGDVTVLTSSSEPGEKSQLYITLDGTGGGSGSVNFLPGGTYNLFGRYGGDGTYSASESTPVSITVTPEDSIMNVTGYNLSGFNEALVNSASIPYGFGISLDVVVTGATATSSQSDGYATGTVTVSDNGSPFAVLPLNSSGAAYYIAPGSVPYDPSSAIPVGPHSLTFSYSGDASFNKTTKSNISGPLNFTVTKGDSYTFLYWPGDPESGPPATPFVLPAGGSLVVQALVGAQSGSSETGNVVVTLGNLPPQTVPLTPTTKGQAIALATFNNVPAGTYALNASYAGDSNWKPSVATPDTVVVAASSLLPTTATSR